MKDNKYISQSEIDKIEEINLDEDIINARKNNNSKLFIKIQIKKCLCKIQQSLAHDESIDFYVSGRNYSIDSARVNLACSAFFSRYGHPIYGWNVNCLLVKTNKRFILIEATAGFEYSKHYNISNEFHLVTKGDNFYLTILGNNKKTIVEFNNRSYDLMMDAIKDAANIIIDKNIDEKLLPKNKFLLMSMTKLVIIFLIFDLIILILSWCDVIKI